MNEDVRWNINKMKELIEDYEDDVVDFETFLDDMDEIMDNLSIIEEEGVW